MGADAWAQEQLYVGLIGHLTLDASPLQYHQAGAVM